ncbi:MAG: hypothetical protein R3C18_23505 [Planctomycetaceae bacterium]
MSNRVMLHGQVFRFLGQCDSDQGASWCTERVGLSAPAVGLYECRSGTRVGLFYVRIVDEDQTDDIPEDRKTWVRLGGPQVCLVDPLAEFGVAGHDAAGGQADE